MSAPALPRAPSRLVTTPGCWKSVVLRMRTWKKSALEERCPMNWRLRRALLIRKSDVRRARGSGPYMWVVTAFAGLLRQRSFPLEDDVAEKCGERVGRRTDRKTSTAPRPDSTGAFYRSSLDLGEHGRSTRRAPWNGMEHPM
jgi:hypothetical protein